jgi:hypothetical protein
MASGSISGSVSATAVLKSSSLRWLRGSSEEDTLARAIENGDREALAQALKTGKVQVKKRG